MKISNQKRVKWLGEMILKLRLYCEEDSCRLVTRPFVLRLKGLKKVS